MIYLMILLCYLLGSLCAAIPVCRLFGLPDPRSGGSRNPGATNVYRLGGRVPAAVTLVLDFAKGFLPLLLIRLWLQPEDLWLGLCALAAFLGHLYPVFYRFEGGKGVATALGVLTACAPVSAALTLAAWLAVFKMRGISSLAALCALIAAPLFVAFVSKNIVLALLFAVISALSLWRHRSNIQRLLSGQETATERKG